MTRSILCVQALAIAFGVSAVSAEEKRSADAHEHGHGLFRMAIEDDHAEIELEVPAFDIVGFEHTPSTAEHRATITAAAAMLGRPDTLFAMPDAAGCVVGQVEIGFGALGGHGHDHGGEEHDEHADHGHDEHGHDDHGHDDHAGEKEAHSEVMAFYRLVCADTAAIDEITFGYFESFPNAEELEVVVLSASGQSAGEVSRDNAVFEVE